jgi:hypothetical protein
MFMLTRNIVIGHMVPLTAMNGSSATSRYFQMIMEETPREDLLRKLKRLWERVTGSKQVVARLKPDPESSERSLLDLCQCWWTRLSTPARHWIFRYVARQSAISMLG